MNSSFGACIRKNNFCLVKIGKICFSKRATFGAMILYVDRGKIELLPIDGIKSVSELRTTSHRWETQRKKNHIKQNSGVTRPQGDTVCQNFKNFY